MWRFVKWVVGIVVVLVVAVFVVLPLLANTAQGKKQLASALKKALHRDVTIGDLSVGLFFSSIDVKDLVIKNPPDFPAGNLLKADRLTFDMSLKKIVGGQIVGKLTGKGIDLHVIKKGAATNLDGMFTKSRPEKPEKKEAMPNLDLKVDVSNSRLVVEDLTKNETLTVDGVGAETHLTNSEGVSKTKIHVTVKSLAKDTLRVHDFEMDATQAGDYLDVDSLKAQLADQGKLSGSGRVQIRGGDAWQAKLNANHVALDREMLPVVALFLPLASAGEGKVSGTFDAAFDLKGSGLDAEKIKQSLSGTGSLSMSDLGLPGSSVPASLLAAATGKPASGLTLGKALAQFGFQGGWVQFSQLTAGSGNTTYKLGGKVSLDGRLDLTTDILPLVKQFGGQGTYAKVAQVAKQIPVRIAGTTSSPQLALPKADDLMQGVVPGLLEKLKKGIK